LSRDLVLARTSIIFGTIGSALIAFAAVPWLFIVSYVIYSCGAGFSPVCRGLLVAIVEPHMLATLNTTISTANSVMGLVLIPAFGWLLGRGFELGGVLDGLPFIVIFGSTMLITVAVFLWRVPAGMDRSPGPQ
jgi:MFS family permease